MFSKNNRICQLLNSTNTNLKLLQVSLTHNNCKKVNSFILGVIFVKWCSAEFDINYFLGRIHR